MNRNIEIAQTLCQEYKFVYVNQQDYTGGLSKGKCPQCSDKSLYTTQANPVNYVVCSHKNSCGYKERTKTLLPDLYKKPSRETHPPTAADPKATARAYLKSRGIADLTLNRTSEYWSQGELRLQDEQDQKTFHIKDTVAFQLPNGAVNHRLIGWEGKNKSRFNQGDSFKGQVWMPFDLYTCASFSQFWFVEGCIDALSLYQAGIHAVATLSSGHVPTEFIDRLANAPCFKQSGSIISSVQIVIALDDDPAGHAGAKKLYQAISGCFSDISYALAPQGNDWNDLLRKGKLDGEKDQVIDAALHRGALHFAENAKAAYAVHAQRHESPQFEWNGRYWYGMLSKKEDGATSVRPLSNFTIRPMLYSVQQRAADGETVYSYEAELVKDRDGKKQITRQVKFASKEIASTPEFKSKCIASGPFLWRGKEDDLNWVIQNRFIDKNPATVWQLITLGYDEASDSYFFKEDAYAPDGSHIPLSADGYFDLQGVKYALKLSTDEQSFARGAAFDRDAFFDLLSTAYGHKGMACLGFLTASLFAKQLSAIGNRFPILSLYGEPNTGKSALLHIFNRLCGRNVHEGISMSKVDTNKGVARSLARVSNLPIALIELNDERAGRFDMDSVLSLYNREPQGRSAQRTHGNETYATKFLGTLVFAQNVERFVGEAQRSRVVSFEFKQREVKLGAIRKLMGIAPEMLTQFRHIILCNRAQLQVLLVECYRRYYSEFSKVLNNDRVAANYAMVAAGAHGCWRTLLGADAAAKRMSALQPYLLECAQATINKMTEDSPLVQSFYETVEILFARYAEPHITNYADSRNYPDEIWLSLTEVRKAAYDVLKIPLEKDTLLLSELRSSKHFVAKGSFYTPHRLQNNRISPGSMQLLKLRKTALPGLEKEESEHPNAPFTTQVKEIHF